eukprot:jgi/Mesvir1/2067/Mv02321-RA.2
MGGSGAAGAKSGTGGGTDKLTQKSPAEFFAENKNIAGFDNPGKSLYTTVRELVENALDAAESIRELPDIELSIEEVSQSRYNASIGLVDHARVDSALYDDFETEKEREKRLAREAKAEAKLQAKSGAGTAATGASAPPAADGGGADNKPGGGKDPVGGKAGAKGGKDAAKSSRGHASFFRVTCKDNGTGMAHDDIPNMLGRVLSGTKYGVKQTRGKFGLGAKMALIWSKMSTGLPIEVWSAKRGQSFRSYCKLDIDIHKNVPKIHAHEKLPNGDKWHGSELKLLIEGNWTTYRAKILSYLRQLAIITPYAQFTFRFSAAEAADKNFSIRFARRTDIMPPVPVAAKHHPSAVNLMLLKRLAAETTSKTLLQLLTRDLDCIKKDLALRLISEMGPEFSPDADPKTLSDNQLVRMHQLFRQAKFPDPDGSCLSPAGEYNLRLGIMKEMRPDMVATNEGSARVFEGHPFIVEAGVSIGGKNVKPGINVFRFANRIPLLFEAGGDVVTRTATKKINWGAYKINVNTDRIGVFVSIVSTKIPFKGTGKEYIGADVVEMEAAVKSALQQCCLQLKAKLQRQQQARESKERKKNLIK